MEGLTKLAESKIQAAIAAGAFEDPPGKGRPLQLEDPFERVRSYSRAERTARSADRGVWRRCDGDFHDPL